MLINAKLLQLDWESKFFKSKIAKLFFAPNFSKIHLNQLEQFNIIETKINTNNILLLDQLINIGFKLVTTNVDLFITISDVYDQSAILSNKTNLIFADTNDITFLKNIAAEIFTYTRFRLPWYPIEDKKRFYSTWIEKAIQGTFDDVCLLIKNNQNYIKGFVTIKKLSNNIAKIGLLGTIPLFRGQSVGNQLIIIAYQWCQKHGIKKLNITTQINNIYAMRLYFNIKAQYENSFYWLYKKYEHSIL